MRATGLSLALIASTAAAVAPALVLANTNAETIVEPTIYMGSSFPGALIKISPAFTSGLGGCTYTTGDYVFIDFAAPVTPNGRDVYASVLAAFLAGRQVSFGTTGCSPDGVYPRVYGVNLLQ